MITDEELAELPDDPELAFVHYENKLREKVDIEDDYQPEVAREYVAHIHAFIDEYSIEIQTEPPPEPSHDFHVYYIGLRRRIDYFSARARLRTARGGIAGLADRVYLSDDYRGEIHKLLGTIRKIVNSANIESQLRERIFKQINILAAEVDRSVSRLSAFTSMYLGVTDAIGQGAENLEPLMSKIERIAKILGRAKSQNENGTLPPPDKLRMLTGPAHDKDISARDEVSSEIDDETQF